MADDPKEPAAKKRRLTYSTYQKWKRDLDCDCQTVSWLSCEKTMEGGKAWVKRMSCTVCAKYQQKIVGKRNYSERWISGTDSFRTINVCDHAHSAQHQHAMSLLKREKAAVQGESSSSYAPIVAALSTAIVAALSTVILEKSILSLKDCYGMLLHTFLSLH